MRWSLVWLALSLQGCSSLKAMASPSVVKDWHKGWQYRFGDSPFENGAPVWRLDARQNPHWIDQTFPEWPDKNDTTQTIMWQRNKIPHLADDRQTLFIAGAWKTFEAYIDDRLVYRYGNWNTGSGRSFPGKAWHVLPLRQEDSNKWLLFRFYSDDQYIGLYDQLHLGTYSDHLMWMTRRDLPLLVMGSIYIFLGLGLIVAFLFRRVEAESLYFGGFALVIGVYEICITGTKQIMYHAPDLWGVLEIAALYSSPVTLGLFIESLLGAGPWRMTRKIWQGATIYLIGSFLYCMVTRTSLWDTLLPFQILLLGTAVLIVGIVAHMARRGNPNARTFFLGIVVLAATTVHDVLASIGVVNGLGALNHVGVLAMLVALGFIVMRRMLLTVSLRKNMELASTVQKLLLPSELNGRFGPFVFSYSYEPIDKMSGDWINFWETDEELRLIFGDVMGSGPRAALAVASIAAFLENSKNMGESVEGCICRINDGLRKLFDETITSTFSAVCLRKDGTVRLYNCGGIGFLHCAPSPIHAAMPSMFLGMMVRPRVSQKSLRLRPGEYMLGFSDGVVQGSKQLARLKRDFRTSKSSMEDIFDAITAVRDPNTKDDRTIIVVKMEDTQALVS